MEFLSFFQADEYFEMVQQVYHFANKCISTRQAKAKQWIYQVSYFWGVANVYRQPQSKQRDRIAGDKRFHPSFALFNVTGNNSTETFRVYFRSLSIRLKCSYVGLVVFSKEGDADGVQDR